MAATPRESEPVNAMTLTPVAACSAGSFSNVHVTFSAGPNVTITPFDVAVTFDAPTHEIGVRSTHPLVGISVNVYAPPAGSPVKACVFGKGVGLPSSSRVNDAGTSGGDGDAVNTNVVGLSGIASLTIVIEPCWVFTNVHTIVSPAVNVIATEPPATSVTV